MAGVVSPSDDQEIKGRERHLFSRLGQEIGEGKMVYL